MIRATIYGGIDGGGYGWKVDDMRPHHGESYCVSSGEAPSRKAAEDAADDAARALGSPLGPWTRGSIPGSRVAIASGLAIASEIAAAVSVELRRSGIIAETMPEERDHVWELVRRLLRSETVWRDSGKWTE